VHGFFREERNRRILEELKQQGVRPREAAGAQSLLLEGKTIVFTGDLDNYTRDQARELVERLGGRATSSVSGNTDYLVAGRSPGSKLDRARERGVQVLDEEGFERLVGKG
jgi:DNA ligase (NAD+)